MMIMRKRGFYVATIGFATLSTIGVNALGAPANEPNDRASQELTAGFEKCVATWGDKYVEARRRLLQYDADRLRSLLARVDEATEAWEQVLVGKAIRTRLLRPDACSGFEVTLERWIRTSATMSIIPKHPVSGPIGTFCRKSISETPALEAIVLERLFKYDNPPHVQEGILKALGHDGTAQALDPLIAMMKSPQGPCIQCALSVGSISGRLGDTRAVSALVQLYRTRPRKYGTGFPEDVLRTMPPWPQAALASALRSIGGEESLRALEQLQRDEKHDALRAQIEKAITSVRDGLEKGTPRTGDGR